MFGQRGVLFTSLLALAIGCAPKETIVVKEPATTNAKANADGSPVATDPKTSDRDIADDADWRIRNPTESEEFARTVDKVANMVSDGDLQQRVGQRKLSLVNVMWEDTGRAEGSATFRRIVSSFASATSAMDRSRASRSPTCSRT